MGSMRRDAGPPLGRAHGPLFLGVVGSLGGCCPEEGGHGLRYVVTFLLWLRLKHRLRATWDAPSPVEKLWPSCRGADGKGGRGGIGRRAEKRQIQTDAEKIHMFIIYRTRRDISTC